MTISNMMKISKSEIQAEIDHLKEHFTSLREKGYVRYYDETFCLYTHTGAQETIKRLRRLETFLNSIVNRTEL